MADLPDPTTDPCAQALLAYIIVTSFYKPSSINIISLSIRRFWGKGERWKRKRERAEGEKRLTQMLLLN